MGTTAKAGGTDFPKAPIGTHIARCYQVIDLGHQKIVWQGTEKWQPKIMLTWELLGDERMEDGKPFAISNRYTLSLSDKSNLAPMLEAWRGKPFTPQEREGFDIQNVLGAYCMLNVVHNKVEDRTYANVSAVMAMPKNTPKPDPINENLYFNMDTDELTVLPEWLQNIVKKSREFTAEPEQAQSLPGRFEEVMDDIPF